VGKITKNKSVTPNSKGFTLIELMIAFAILGIMMAAIIPMLRQQPGYERKQFIARLNALTQFAWQQAIVTRAVHRVLFKFKEREITVERVKKQTMPPQKIEYEATSGPDASTKWSSAIIIKQFILEGFDEMKRFAGRSADTIWFFIIPDGMAQQVTINAVDKEDMIDNKPRPFSLVLNPFLAQFKEYDTFQK
jgi:prepilin-type N-terminal cleavage/methylation domain-containing protein